MGPMWSWITAAHPIWLDDTIRPLQSPPEGCQSGRMGRSRKSLWPPGHRGFESLTFRHTVHRKPPKPTKVQARRLVTEQIPAQVVTRSSGRFSAGPTPHEMSGSSSPASFVLRVFEALTAPQMHEEQENRSARGVVRSIGVPAGTPAPRSESRLPRSSLRGLNHLVNS
jgi:hypothetical protein